MAAGLDTAWAIEYDPKIADVARKNLGDHVITANIIDVDPATLSGVDVLHASPPCPNFSVAKQGGTETAADIALANKVAEYIDVLRPRIFTLENVTAYRRSTSWSLIRERLYECGYWLDVAILKAADFGVPQTRKRMIVRAIRGEWVPMLPQPEPWIGWYAAIDDLISTLPDTTLANWQIKRLPEEIISSFMIGGGNTSDVQAAPGVGCRDISEPAHCVTTTSALGTRAVLVRCLQRAVLPCRIVKITPRCLARFQSFPDWYELPDSTTLAVRGIGNAVPPLMYEKIIRQLVNYLEN